MPKFNSAYYLDADGEWASVSYKHLKDENLRAILRSKELREKECGRLQLGIRNHQQTPHFYSRRPFRLNLEPSLRESKAHDDWIIKFLNQLSMAGAKHRFGFYEKPWEDGRNRGFEVIAEAKNYWWDKEVSFGCVYGKYIRFDLFGRYNSSISLMDANPLVAIEVIDTHFPSKESFSTMISISRNLPIQILFFSLEKEPYLNQIHPPPRKNAYAELRIHHYISDGSFWDRYERIEDIKGVDVDPQQPSEYYHLVKDRLVQKDFIRVE